LKDIPTAARLFCRGSRFADATRLLALNGQQSLIPEIVDTGLADAMGSTTDFLADCRAQLLAQVPRIRELREKRVADPLAFFGGDPAGDFGGVDIPDNVSLAPTDVSTAAGSMFTRYTGGTAMTSMTKRTSRTRRREERKRARGKKGTVYEEEYLVNSVRRLIERVNGTVDEVQVLVEALLRHGMRERAAAVEKALQEVLEMCSNCREEVFEEEIQKENGTTVMTDAATAENVNGGALQREEEPRPPLHGGDAVLWDSIQARDGRRTAPAVREFKKLALLG
jgi:elongator complex protein 1